LRSPAGPGSTRPPHYPSQLLVTPYTSRDLQFFVIAALAPPDTCFFLTLSSQALDSPTTLPSLFSQRPWRYLLRLPVVFAPHPLFYLAGCTSYGRPKLASFFPLLGRTNGSRPFFTQTMGFLSFFPHLRTVGIFFLYPPIQGTPPVASLLIRRVCFPPQSCLAAGIRCLSPLSRFRSRPWQDYGAFLRHCSAAFCLLPCAPLPYF